MPAVANVPALRARIFDLERRLTAILACADQKCALCSACLHAARIVGHRTQVNREAQGRVDEPISPWKINSQRRRA
jgi:hypothetical protein